MGDSRIYRLRNNKLEQLTFDHSLVWEMEAQGLKTSGEGVVNVPKNVITRSLGPNAQAKVDLEGPMPIEVFGAHNLNNVFGYKRIFNNQTGGAKAQVCYNYNGGNCGGYITSWSYEDHDFGPINSIRLSA